MIIIRNLKDIAALRESRTSHQALVQAVDMKFHQLMEAFADPDQPPEDFTLQETGNIYILEPGEPDAEGNLPGAGLPMGLYWSFPEYATLERLEDGSNAVVLWIMYDNEWMASLWFQEFTWSSDPRLAEFLEEYLEEGQHILPQEEGETVEY